MRFILTITPVGSTAEAWKLAHNPAWEIPFITLEGTVHIWNWDFVNGNLLKDGEQLVGYTITIEREDATV